ncbi:MAG: energy transducer TonB [Sphingomonadales bacterium]
MLVRLPISIFIAGLLTFGLYFGMQLLILSGESAQTEDLSFKIVDTRIPPRETEVQRKEQQIERPEKIEAPEPPKIDIARSSVSNGSGVNMDFKFSGGVDVGGGINFNAVDRDAQPIYRQEPEFQNIRKPEFIVLEFDVRPDGSVAEDTIQVLQTSSTRLQRPAIRAVKKWKYQGKVIIGENVWQYGVRVQFTIQPPE